LQIVEGGESQSPPEEERRDHVWRINHWGEKRTDGVIKLKRNFITPRKNIERLEKVGPDRKIEEIRRWWEK